METTMNEQPEKFIVPMGPQHPALKEPGHFEFTVDGEIVTGASVRLGYAHRGIEKATEGRNWTQNLYLLERICGICSHVHATAYALGVEKLAGVTAPPRAQTLRTLVGELERIHSHLLWLGVAAHEAGFDTLFMFTWRDRETIMDALELLSGNRVNYSLNVLGGVKFDIDDEQADNIRAGLDYLEGRTHHYLDVVMNDVIFRRRTKGVGVMTAAQVNEWGIVGPTARASGLTRDVRLDAPYAAYADFPVKPVIRQTGDLEARFEVRIEELFESYRLIREMLDKMPPGELTTRMPRKIKAGETISRVEAPRGELFYFIQSGGGETPTRIRVRPPTICNLASVTTLAVGHHLADMPMLLTGVDPCFSCNDRAVTLKKADGRPYELSWSALRQMGIDHYSLTADG
jgi:NADH-quinone oxidoreductase subunit D